MFRRYRGRLVDLGCFPRVRGDVPLPAFFLAHYRTVFPACAGMFLELSV